MSYQIFQLPKQTPVNTTLTVVPGAKAYFYVTGTSTPQDTYTDSALTIPHANPVLADANGTFPAIYLDPSKTYKLTLTTAADVLIYTIDPCNDQSLSGNLIGLYLWPRSAAEISAGVTPVNYGVYYGYIERYGTNASPGSTSMSSALLAASQQAAAGGMPVNALTLCHLGTPVTVNGYFSPGMRQVFTNTSAAVTFGKGSVEHVWPQWWGAKGDATVNGTSGTNCTAAFGQAIRSCSEDGTSTSASVAIHPLRCGPGNFLLANIAIIACLDFRGDGRHTTNLVSTTTGTGKFFTDLGSAAKVVVDDMAMYINSNLYTDFFELGFNSAQFGTEGWLRNLWIYADSLTVGNCFRVNGNVGLIDRITTQGGSTGITITGYANMANHLVPYGAATASADLSNVTVFGMEIEAPGNGGLPLYIRRNAFIYGLTFSLSASTTFSHLAGVDVNATTWSVDLVGIVGAASTTVTNGNFRNSDGTYFGGNATAGSPNGEGRYGTAMFLTGATYGLKQGLKTAFKIRLTNTGGTLQHRIGCSSDSSVAGSYTSKIVGASTALTNTPTGADGSTAFAAGLKIGSASTNTIYFDVANAQVQADFLPECVTIVANNTGTAYTLIPQVVSININGSTLIRMAWSLQNATTLANVPWATALTSGGNLVDIIFSGYLR